VTLWIGTIPSWASFVIVVGVSNVLALGAAFVARHWYHRAGVTEGPPVVNSWGSVAGALCAMLFAFTIVTLWNNSTQAYANADTEGSAIRLLTRDLAPSQQPLLRDYVKASIAEWPRLCGGSEDQNVAELLLKLERLAKPRTEAYANDLYAQLGTLEDMRSSRWQRASQSVPRELWVALIVLSLALFVVLAIAMPSRRATHVVLMVVVAASVGSLVWVATVLQHPFCGSNAIGPDELRYVARSHLI
jgi:hypothetical protein